MTVLVHAEIHGLTGRAGELRALLREHAERLAEAPASLGAAAYEPLAGEPGDSSSTRGGGTSRRCERTTGPQSTQTTLSGCVISSRAPAT
jgi:hypothetical protein